MTRFLTLASYKDTLEILQNSARLFYQNERVQVTKSQGSITYQPVYAKLTVPQTQVSQRDGYAVCAADMLQARDSKPVVLQNYIFVHTGSQVPNEYDAVIMQEDVRIEPDQILIPKPARPGQNIQKIGSEISLGKMIIPANHLISEIDIGAMIAYGVTTIEIKKLNVTLIPVGNELKEPCTAPDPGEVIESNTFMLKSYLEKLGITPIVHPIIPDSPKEIETAIQQAVMDSSFVIISGGTSTGKRDFTKSVLSEIGSILYHGIAMRPGKTTLAALVDDIPVFGLPGVPVGTISVFEEIVLPWLRGCGFPVPKSHIIQATVAESIPSELGTDDFIPVVVGMANGTSQAVMVPRGNGQMTYVRANGILHIAHNIEGLKAGGTADIRLIRPYPEPKNVLLMSGVSDLIIDILDQFLRGRQMRLYCKYAKTEAVLLGMQNKGMHGGIISRPHIKGKYSDIDYSLLLEPSSAIHIADRRYIMAFPENAKAKQEHLTCPSIHEKSFLHIFMKEYLQNPSDVEQYLYNTSVTTMCTNEEEIVQKIRCGEIDTGPCSEYLAAEYYLSGPSIGCESIDLIIRDEELENEEIKELMRFLSSETWKKEVELVTGYSAEKSGELSPLIRNR